MEELLRVYAYIALKKTSDEAFYVEAHDREWHTAAGKHISGIAFEASPLRSSIPHTPMRSIATYQALYAIP